MVSGLPIPVPFTRKEWESTPLSDLLYTKPFLDFHTRCVEDIHKSRRSDDCITLFLVASHVGRLPEFSTKSYPIFLEEAKRQPLTAARLERTLDFILSISGPGEALPSAAAAFEFVTIAADFAGFAVDKQFAGNERLRALVKDLGAFGVILFILAINVELGIEPRDGWRVKTWQPPFR
ncbi:MAG: hypothetical protein IT432_00775 [Phycisphaerales bacterium]|nr:hypothetical protein [Phycisphaerales bacterium]